MTRESSDTVDSASILLYNAAKNQDLLVYMNLRFEMERHEVPGVRKS